MSLSAWLMLGFAAVVLLGGLALCLVIARRTDTAKERSGVRYGDDGDE